MRFVTATIICVGLALSAPAFADDVKPATKVEVKAPASAPASQPVVEDVKLPEGAPQNLEEAMESAKEGIAFAKAKNWWGMSAVVIFILMFVLKAVGVFKKVGKRWAYVIVPGLSVVAMLLAKFAGGVSWGAAVTVLTSGPAMAALTDLVKRGVLGKEHSTPVKK
jgi:hypothetical protein